jgi:hypothetical protein
MDHSAPTAFLAISRTCLLIINNALSAINRVWPALAFSRINALLVKIIEYFSMGFVVILAA